MYAIARGVEASCWMAGRDHDYPEQFAAGLKPHAVREKYYYARRPEITRVVDISGVRGSKSRGQPRQSGQGPRRPSRVAAPRGAGEKAAALAAAGRRRRDGRPQLHQGVSAGTQPRAGPEIRRAIRRSVSLHRPWGTVADRRLHPKTRRSGPRLNTVANRPATPTMACGREGTGAC